MFQLKGLLSLLPQICMYPINTGSPHDLICKRLVFSFTVFYIKSLFKMSLSSSVMSEFEITLEHTVLVVTYTHGKLIIMPCSKVFLNF